MTDVTGDQLIQPEEAPQYWGSEEGAAVVTPGIPQNFLSFHYFEFTAFVVQLKRPSQHICHV